MNPYLGAITVGAVLVVGGCTRDMSAVKQMTRAADPSVKVPGAGYQTVSSGNVPYTPIGPKGWEELNRRVGPKS